MSESLLMLRIEHENFAKLLGVLEDQLRLVARGGDLDANLLGLVSDYFSGYPSRCHHPKEDIFYRKLTEKNPLEGRGISNLVHEHVELEEMTRRFAELVASAREADGPPTELIRDVIPEFIAMHRDHMAREERHFFRAAQEILTPDDFAEIEYEFFDRKDPVFHHEAEARYKALREEIYRLGAEAAQAAPPQSGPLSDAELTFLQGASTVALFNAAMKFQQLKLVALGGGGYALDQAKRLILTIPECSEARATWCAYFFLRGRDGAVANVGSDQ